MMGKKTVKKFIKDFKECSRKNISDSLKKQYKFKRAPTCSSCSHCRGLISLNTATCTKGIQGIRFDTVCNQHEEVKSIYEKCKDE